MLYYLAISDQNLLNYWFSFAQGNISIKLIDSLKYVDIKMVFNKINSVKDLMSVFSYIKRPINVESHMYTVDICR